MQITTEITDGVALITMDDGKKNAITPDAYADLDAALDQAEADADAIVFAGRPGAFCAGFDLATMTSGDVDAIMEIARGGARFALRLWSTPKPLVTACTGHAFTIGAIWLSCGDTRVGDRGDFKIGMTETRMGMTFTPWALAPLEYRLSKQHWIKAIVQAHVYDPDTAVDAGFLDEVVDDGHAVARALEIAADLTTLNGKAYAKTKLMTRADSITVMRDDIATMG
ncbi:MAG: crotonase/enoyl-CoA hydratase family protein [Actinomycetota bacterium]